MAKKKNRSKLRRNYQGLNLDKTLSQNNKSFQSTALGSTDKPKMLEGEIKGGFISITKKALIVLILALLCAGVVAYKVHLFKQLPFLDPQDGDGFFWTESAFHFRHFLMIAEGNGIPPIDYGIQYPEGLDTARDITLLTERITGSLYRLFFSNMPPHLFVSYFSFLFSTLSVLAIFLAGKIVWGSNIAAFISAFFYGFTPASLMRTAGGGFIREDFALPFIFFGFACFLYCFRKDRPIASGIGSAFLFIALADWHATQLYLSLFMVGMVVAYFVNKREGVPPKSLTIFVAFMVMAALLLPVLRDKYFICSPALMLGYGLLAAFWLPLLKNGNKRKKFIIGHLILVALFVASLFIQKLAAGYSHAYGLLFYKLRFLGSLPEDPARLSFEAKTMWTSSFVSPGWIELPLLLCFSLPFGIIGVVIMVYRLCRRKAEHHELVLVYFTVCTFVLFLMMHRMIVFAVFFLVLSMGVLTLLRKPLLKYAIYGCLGLCFLIQLFIMLDSFGLKAFRPDQNHLKSLLSFIRAKTDKEAPVLTTFQLGPAVALYTGHPVTLHSKFESKLLRDKVKDVYTSLFQSEGEFYKLCQRYKVSLFVYDSDIALNGKPMSTRYLVGAIPLKTDSGAFLFHFAPDKLKHFALIYQNPSYRVFKVGARTAYDEQEIKYEPIYDLDNFLEERNGSEFIADAVLESGRVGLGNSETHRKIGDRFFVSGDYQTAVLQYKRALGIDPQNTRAAWALGRALLQAGEKERATEVFRVALRLDPGYDMTILDIQNLDIWVAMALDELERKRYERAERIFKKAIQVKPGTEKAYFGLGEALSRQEKLEEAKVAYKKLISLNPYHYNAYENLGKIYAAQGDMESAAICVKKSLAINPNQPHLHKVLNLIRTEMQRK